MNAASRVADFERRLGAVAPTPDIGAMPAAVRDIWTLAGKPPEALLELPNIRAFLAACLRRIAADDLPTL